MNINSGNAGLGDGIMTFILNLNSKSDLSPKGLTSLLSFIDDAVNNDRKPFIQKVFKTSPNIIQNDIRDLPDLISWEDKQAHYTDSLYPIQDHTEGFTTMGKSKIFMRTNDRRTGE